MNEESTALFTEMILILTLRSECFVAHLPCTFLLPNTEQSKTNKDNLVLMNEQMFLFSSPEKKAIC